MKKREIHTKDLGTFVSLDMVYNKVRIFQSRHNETEFGCVGSGKCCKVGLKIHMTEAAYIAFRMRQEYYLIMEDRGEASATEWMNGKIDQLLSGMYDDSWDWDEQTVDGHCSFWDDGCTIYGYRPLVCRAYGTLTEVDDFCPRKRNEHNTIEHFAGEGVERVVQEFQLLLKKYGEDNGSNIEYDAVVYMPLGVLSFILDETELEELYQQTSDKMWEGFEGWFNYQSRFTRLHGLHEDFIMQEAKLRGAVDEDGNILERTNNE
jgi:Fe-S-cluster containining protein